VDKTGLTLIALWLHVPFVTVWVGLVMLDLFASIAPGLDPIQRGRMLTWSRPFVILALVVIIATGTWQTIYNPFNVVTSIDALERLRSTTVYGMALFWKHGFVLVTFGLTILTRFVLAPRLVTAALVEEGEEDLGAIQQLRTISWIAAANLMACLAALLLATRMVWELH
jgi:putative copper export protein